MSWSEVLWELHTQLNGVRQQLASSFIRWNTEARSVGESCRKKGITTGFICLYCHTKFQDIIYQMKEK